MNGIICANNRECFENPAASSSHSELNIRFVLPFNCEGNCGSLKKATYSLRKMQHRMQDLKSFVLEQMEGSQILISDVIIFSKHSRLPTQIIPSARRNIYSLSLASI